MRPITLGIFALAAAAGYVGARRLLEGDLPDDAPERLRAPLLGARGRLRRLRDDAVEALAAAGERRDEAERELYADYFSRTGRSEPQAQSGSTAERL